MSHKEEKEQDLVSLLSTEQRVELTLLIATATERMRKSISDTFNAPPPKTSEPPGKPPTAAENPNTEKPTQAPTGAQALGKAPKPEKQCIPTPRLAELKKHALSSFDTWSSSVLQRISEAVSPDLESTEKTHISHDASITASKAPKVSALYEPIQTPLTTTLPHEYRPMVLHALLLLLLSLERYDARSRVLLLIVSSSLHVPFTNLIEQESQTAGVLIKAALMSADEESKARSDKSKFSKWWKVGLASAAGAVAIGVTGGLAAPLVAAGVGGVMGGIGLGGTVAAGYLGAVASSGAIVGALFGAYGGKMTGEMMERYAAAVNDFAFLPVRDRVERLRVTVGISGWLTAPEEVVLPWSCLNSNSDVYALRWEMGALLDLGSSLQTILKSYAWGYVKSEIIKRTVLASLWTALWPVGLLKIARVVDNPFSIAKHRSEKAGKVLADAIINRTQGERPITLIGFSLGARVIYSCLLSLAERNAFGLVENVVLIGSPVPTSVNDWKAIRSIVAGRVVNVYSASDYILAFLYRTSSIQLGVAGLQSVQGVKGVENIDAGKVVEGHLRYRYVIGMLLRDILMEDVDMEEVGKQERILKTLIQADKQREKEGRGVEGEGGEKKMEGDIDSVVEKAEKELEERRRKRQEEEGGKEAEKEKEAEK